LVAGRDSFAILVQGNPLGAMISSVEPGTEDGRAILTVKSEMHLGALGGQSAEFVLDASTLDPIRYEQTASQMGQTVQAELAYGPGGHVTGSIAGAGEATIDTVFGSTVYDMDMLPTLVRALPLAEGASFTMGTFLPTEQAFASASFRVSDGGVVTVPAGEFDTWQVNLSAQVPWVYWVSKDQPRRVVKMEIAGQPLVFELAGTESR
jgi:hypothetical protein